MKHRLCAVLALFCFVASAIWTAKPTVAAPWDNGEFPWRYEPRFLPDNWEYTVAAAEWKVARQTGIVISLTSESIDSLALLPDMVARDEATLLPFSPSVSRYAPGYLLFTVRTKPPSFSYWVEYPGEPNHAARSVCAGDALPASAHIGLLLIVRDDGETTTVGVPPGRPYTVPDWATRETWGPPLGYAQATPCMKW